MENIISELKKKRKDVNFLKLISALNKQKIIIININKNKVPPVPPVKKWSVKSGTL